MWLPSVATGRRRCADAGKTTPGELTALPVPTPEVENEEGAKDGRPRGTPPPVLFTARREEGVPEVETRLVAMEGRPVTDTGVPGVRGLPNIVDEYPEVDGVYITK